MVICVTNIFLFSLISTLVSAQSNLNFSKEIDKNYTIEYLSDKVDMPQTIIKSIFMDNRGFLWMTNYAGDVLRYDGSKVRSYSNGQGLEYWDPSEDHNVLVSHNIQTNAYDLIVKANGRDHFLTFASIYNGRLNHLKRIKNHYKLVRCQSNVPNYHVFLTNDSIRKRLGFSSYADSEIAKMGCFSLDSVSGYIYNIPGDSIQTMRYFTMKGDTPQMKFMAEGILMPLSMPYKSSLLMIDSKAGIREFSNETCVRTYPVSEFSGNVNQLISETSRFVNISNINEPVLKDGSTLIHISGDLGDLHFDTLLQGVYIHDISGVVFTPKKDHIFISSSSQGIIHLRKKKFRNTFRDDGSKQSYYSIIEHSGSLITTCKERISIDDFQSFEEDDPFSARSKVVDDSGNVYTESYYQLWKLGKQQREWKKIAALRTIVGLEKTVCMGLDSRNNLFYAEVDSLVNVTQGKTYVLSDAENVQFLCMKFKSDKEVSLGTSKGIYIVNLETGNTVHLSNTTNLTVRDIFPLNDSTDILATYGKGLYFLQKGRLIKAPMKDFNKGALFQHRIIRDKFSSLWVSTNSGLLRYSQKGINVFLNGSFPFLGYQYYDKYDGFNTNEFNGGQSNCGIQTTTGLIVFPSLRGLVYFKPDELLGVDNTEYLIIEAYVDGKTIEQGNILKIDAQRMNFVVSSPNYSNPNNLQFVYRLIGENQNWALLPQNGEISFTNLKSGKKIFEIKRLVMNGNHVTSKFEFKVPKKWHETWWFRVLIIGGIAMLFYGISLARITFLKNAAKALEVRVDEQYKELIEKKQQLEGYVSRLEISEKSLSKQMTLREKLIEIISHDAMGSLNFIRYISQELDVNGHQLSEEDQAKYLENLHAATDSIYKTMNRILSWIKTQREEMTVLREAVPVQKLLSNIDEYFVIPAQVNQIKFETDIESELVAATDSEILSSILRNLLENEVKHNQDVTIYVKGYKQADKVIIHIKNPFAVLGNIEAINQLFESKTNEDYTTLGLTGGLGLLLIKELALTIGAKIHYSTLGENGHQIFVELDSA